VHSHIVMAAALLTPSQVMASLLLHLPTCSYQEIK